MHSPILIMCTSIPRAMTITAIKQYLNIPELTFRPSQDENGAVSTEWSRTWCNVTKTDVNIPTDLIEQAIAGCDEFIFHKTEKTSSKGNLYTKVTIVLPKKNDNEPPVNARF